MGIFKKNKVPTKKITVIIFVLSILMMIATYTNTQSKLMDIELRDFTASIKKDTKQNLAAARNLLDGMVCDLENTANQILKYDSLKSKPVREILSFTHSLNLFDVTFVSDMEGNAFDQFGNEFSVADQESFKRARETREVVFSEILPSKRFNAIQIIAYPFYSENGEMDGVLFGLFKVETFSELINAVVDDGNYIFIVDSNGAYINYFDEACTTHSHENFWDDVQANQLEDTTVEKLKEDFHNGKEGGFFYGNQEDVQIYVYHMPLGIQDWQIVLSVEESVVNSHIRSIRYVDAVDLILDLICFTSMMLCIYSYFKSANRKVVTVNEELSKNNEMLSMAVEHSQQIIFEYDIASKTAELKTDVSKLPFDSNVIKEVPDCILTMNFIAPDSIEPFRQLFEKIKTERSSQAEIQFVSRRSDKIWFRISMYNIYNDNGMVVGTVGRAENISMLKKGEAAIKRRDEMYKSFRLNALLYARVDLSTERVLELNGKEMNEPYQRHLNRFIEEYVCEEHKSYVAQMLSPETLKEEYGQNKEYYEIQCLMKNKAGAVKWVSCIVCRIHMSDSPKVTFLIRDIDEKKRREIELKEQAEKDGLTGLYNAATTRTKVNEVLSSMHSADENQVFVLFDLDNFKQINDTFGHICGDQVLKDISGVLQDRFRSGDIVGRLGGDEFVIMLCNLRSDKYVDNFIKDLISSMTKTYTFGGVSVTVSASMGVAVAPVNGTTFEALYKKADDALYQVKKEGKNGYKRCE